MTKDRASANDISLPKLIARIQGVQREACLLNGLIEALTFIDNEGGCENGRKAIGMLAEEMSGEISTALDLIVLQRGQA